MKFYGIADAHGLESFQPTQFDITSETFSADSKEVGFMYLRAMANRQRHAVVYQADLAPDDAKEVMSMFDGGKYVEALLKLKESARTISLAKIPGAEKSWRLIPNSDLDPFSS